MSAAGHKIRFVFPINLSFVCALETSSSRTRTVRFRFRSFFFFFFWVRFQDVFKDAAHLFGRIQRSRFSAGERRAEKRRKSEREKEREGAKQLHWPLLPVVPVHTLLILFLHFALANTACFFLPSILGHLLVCTDERVLIN